MATVRRFEDLRVWQTARQLVKQVYALTETEAFAQDRGLRDQIRRAAVSVMSNIAEGFDAGSDAEFVRFLRYARRSASETQSHIYTALDQNYLSRERFQSVYDTATSAKRQINALIAYLRRSQYTVREPTAPYALSLPDDYTASQTH